jgi:hypothetical protein
MLPEPGLRAERAGGDFALARRRPDGTTTLMVTDLRAKGAEADHYASRMKRAFNIISVMVQSPACIPAGSVVANVTVSIWR